VPCLTPSRFEVNQRFSPLLRLPAELRIKIYEYATSSYHEVDLCDPNETFTETAETFTALRRTSRQLHIELRTMSIKVNVFKGTVKSVQDTLSRYAGRCILLGEIHTVYLTVLDRDGFYFRGQCPTLCILFDMLPGLKYVVVRRATRWNFDLEDVSSFWKREVRWALKRSGRRSGVEVQLVRL
jgi:hypothetical protein